MRIKSALTNSFSALGVVLLGEGGGAWVVGYLVKVPVQLFFSATL